jgi:hypothetical protein
MLGLQRTGKWMRTPTALSDDTKSVELEMLHEAVDVLGKGLVGAARARAAQTIAATVDRNNPGTYYYCVLKVSTKCFHSVVFVLLLS